MRKSHQSQALTATVRTLTALAESHGLEAVNEAYAETIAAVMAGREHDAWIAKVTDGQRALLLEQY